jgi:hypothetical protein
LLHEPSIERVKAGTVKGVGLVHLFTDLIEDAEEAGEAAMDMVVTYIDPADEFVVGTWVPELHLIVRRVDAD